MLLNLTLKTHGEQSPERTFGFNWYLQPRNRELPQQLDEVDSLIFEVDAERLAEWKIPDSDWHVGWWNCIVTCSTSEHDPVERRITVWSPGSPHQLSNRDEPG